LDNYAIIGLGSIGQRHASNLKELHPRGYILGVSASGNNTSIPKNIDALVSLEQVIATKPNYAIVASPASKHIETTIELIKNDIPVLIEKPLAQNHKDCLDLQDACSLKVFEKLAVGYCLRFMPSAKLVKNYIDQNLLGPVYNVSVNVGQYLPTWRPGKNYMDSVSANKNLGGGVLLELSHELDYLQWIFGKVSLEHSLLRKSGELVLDVEDVADLVLKNESDIYFNVHLDFVQKSTQRRCDIIGRDGRLLWDLIANKITIFDAQNEFVLYSEPKYNKNDMYIDMIKSFEKKIKGGDNCLADIKGSSDIVKIIEEAKCLNKWS
jgi:predicted dehydrogenase